MRTIRWVLLVCAVVIALGMLFGSRQQPSSHFSKRRHQLRPAQEQEALPMPRVALDRG